jgi:hypothetical protein
MPENTDAPVKVSDRRSVVKTAAHLAWAIPAVQVAAAAPALAVSTTPTPVLQVTGVWVSGTGTTQVFDITVKNTGNATTAGLQLTISSINTVTFDGVTTSTTGWGTTGPTFSAATQLTAGASATVRVSVNRHGNSGAWGVKGAATATNAASASSSNIAAH